MQPAHIAAVGGVCACLADDTVHASRGLPRQAERPTVPPTPRTCDQVIRSIRRFTGGGQSGFACLSARTLLHWACAWTRVHLRVDNVSLSSRHPEIKATPNGSDSTGLQVHVQLRVVRLQPAQKPSKLLLNRRCSVANSAMLSSILSSTKAVCVCGVSPAGSWVVLVVSSQRPGTLKDAKL